MRQLWRNWTYQARFIGSFQARALITLVYFTLLLPFGVVVRYFTDPLKIKPASQQTTSAWIARQTHDLDIESAQRQG